MVGSEKYGRFHNALDKDDTLMDTEPSKGDFRYVESGTKKEQKLKVKIQKKTGFVTLSGKFPDSKNCYELHFKETRYVQCMKGAKIKIKDFNVIDAKDEAVLKKSFILENPPEFDGNLA